MQACLRQMQVDGQFELIEQIQYGNWRKDRALHMEGSQ